VCAILLGAVDGHLLHHLASCIGSEWRQLAVKLGVSRGRIESIHRSASNNRQRAVADLLTSWIKRLPRSADKVHSDVSRDIHRPNYIILGLCEFTRLDIIVVGY